MFVNLQEAILGPHTRHLLQSLQRLVTAAASSSRSAMPRALKTKAKVLITAYSELSHRQHSRAVQPCKKSSCRLLPYNVRNCIC